MQARSSLPKICNSDFETLPMRKEILNESFFTVLQLLYTQGYCRKLVYQSLNGGCLWVINPSFKKVLLQSMLIYKSIHSILHSKEGNPTMIMYSLTLLDFDKLLLLKKNLNFINTRMYLLFG